jgi:hypothetical protein
VKLLGHYQYSNTNIDIAMVPENIREETLKEIKRFLEEIVEKEG